ncbi:MAG: hypothetical protein U5J63_01815 [Fodinibius sp.]|nr:hypothetical protein [Fodinibius sp.]
MDSDQRLQKFYRNGTYKGFRKLYEITYYSWGVTLVSLSKATNSITAIGNCSEEAIENALCEIDNYEKTDRLPAGTSKVA